MSQPIVQLPSILVVGGNTYQRAYQDRHRVKALLEQAAEVGADVSMLRNPQTWEELSPFVKTLKAIISKQRSVLRRRAKAVGN